MITISIKQRDKSGKWHPVKMSDVAGRPLRKLLTDAIDQETVIEVKIDDRRMFFCGTDHWRARMAEKGDAVLMAQAIRQLEQSRPELLAEVIPAPVEVYQVFGDCRVESHTIEGGTE